MNYVHPKGTPKAYVNGGIPGGLHVTAGLAKNWALDMMCPGGTRFLSPEPCKVIRLSGHNPAEGEVAPGIFGWNLYLKSIAAPHVTYFVTHLASRDVKVGRTYRAADILGHVGHWPHDPGRSHTHLGVTHPSGEQAAKDYICKVGKAVKVLGQWPKL